MPAALIWFLAEAILFAAALLFAWVLQNIILVTLECLALVQPQKAAKMKHSFRKVRHGSCNDLFQWLLSLKCSLQQELLPCFGRLWNRTIPSDQIDYMFMAELPVCAVNKPMNRRQAAYLFFDTGSHQSQISASLVERLQLRTYPLEEPGRLNSSITLNRAARIQLTAVGKSGAKSKKTVTVQLLVHQTLEHVV